MAVDPGVVLRFAVTVDHHQDLGNWWKCEGLSMEWEVQEYREGGLNGYVHRIPGRRKYPTIRLTRPVDAASATVTTWLSTLEGSKAGHTMRISIVQPAGGPIVSWDLSGVFPVKWSGPSLDVDGKVVALEVLELAHNGFLPPI